MRSILTIQGSRLLSPNLPTRDGLDVSHFRAYGDPMGTRSRVPTAAPRGARPSQPYNTSARPTGSHSRATTAVPRDVRPSPPSSTCLCPTASRSRATPSTLRAVHSPPQPHKGILDTTGDHPLAGASARLSIRALRHDDRQALQTRAPSPPPRRASRGSPLGAVRDQRGRRNVQI